MSLNHAQYDTLMVAYGHHQMDNKIVLNQRKEEVYANIPRIAEIDELLATASIQGARAKLKGSLSDTSSIKANNKLLINEKNNLLNENGYGEDYLSPIYTCTLCKDTGYVENGSHCQCFHQAAIEILYKQSNMDKILETENFSNFNLDYYPDQKDGIHEESPYRNMKNVLNYAKAFIADFSICGGNILMFGETGTGKTFLSNCIAKNLLDQGHTVLYLSAINLFEDVIADVVLNKNKHPDSETTYRYVYDCDLLIIDDLGTEFTNSLVSTQLYNCLNSRIRGRKSTIISTNLNFKELNELYSDRITTRILAEYKVYKFYGENIRIAKRKNVLTKI